MRHSFRNWVRGIVVGSMLIGASLACDSQEIINTLSYTEVPTIGYQTVEPVITLGPSVTPNAGQADGETIKICSFNIQNLGLSKMSDPEVMGTLADILAQCDITAVQEVSDVSGQVMAALVYDTMNGSAKYDSTYDFELSPRIGLNRSSSNAEQYAFVYNADRISVARWEGTKLAYVYPDGMSGIEDIFAREPYIVEFRAGKFDFALATIHTKPDDAEREICSLAKVIEDAQARFSEGDVLVLGDFNSDGSYFNEDISAAECALKDQKYSWLIGDSLDTTVSVKNDNTYDRIVGDSRFMGEDFTGLSGVFYFDQAQLEGSPFVMVPTTLETKEYSDHYPVWAIFYMNRDTDP